MESGHLVRKPGVLRDYCDGETYEQHPLFSIHFEALQILFYYDDLEVCNPLGSKKKKHKLGNRIANTKLKHRSLNHSSTPSNGIDRF